jgi:diguanylate cyclase (GGDEF)-like protein
MSVHQKNFPPSFLFSLHKRIPLTIKMFVMTVVLAIIIWVLFDFIHTRKLKDIFQTQLHGRLADRSVEDRRRFERYVKAYLHSVKLFISERNFSDYIEKHQWSSKDTIHLKIYREYPEWFPTPSILRTFSQPRHVLLLDAWGNLREIYTGIKNEQLPQSLLKPSQQLLLKSYQQNFITNMDGSPFLIASERYTDNHGNVRAILMITSLLDDIFLSTAHGSSTPGHIVALLTEEENPKILVSSNPDEVPAGTPLNGLSEQYFISGQEFIDYGSAEQVIKFVSLFSISETRSLMKSIISSERQMRVIGFPVFIVSFALLMYWVTRRIHLLTHRIADFSHQALGARHEGHKKGDQLYILEDSFQLLTEEIIEAREKLWKEAEENLRLQRKNMETEQKEKQLKVLQTVTENQGIGVIFNTPQGLQAANQQMEKFERMFSGLSAFEINDTENEEISLVDKNGVNHVFHISIPDIFKEKIVLVRDVTELKAYTDNLERLALHDTLTGLPNRKLFYDRLKQAILVGNREQKSFALLMLDVDSFKEINDTLGHYVGDVVLKEIGKRLMNTLRESDTVARIGGDEFAVLLPGADINYSKHVASRLQDSMLEPCVIEKHNLFIRISIGIALFPFHGKEADPLMRRADAAMYTAKKNQSSYSIYLSGQE